MVLPDSGNSSEPSVKTKSLLKIMKEQVRSKYRRSVHPGSISGHGAISPNGLFAHNPDTEEPTPPAQQLLTTPVPSTQLIGA